MDIYHSTKITDSINIQRPAGEVYALWQNHQELSRLLVHLVGHLQSQGAPHAAVLELVGQQPGRKVEWQIRVGNEVRCRAVTELLPEQQHGLTELRISLELDETPHLARRALQKLRGGQDARSLVRQDLLAIKQVLEDSSETSSGSERTVLSGS